MIVLRVGDKVYLFRWNYETVSDLKRFARFNPEVKEWNATSIPCWFARKYRLPEENCVDGKWWGKNIAYIAREALDVNELERKLCYTIIRWKQENGRRRKVEERICLYREDRGDWRTFRGLVALLPVKMPPYAPALQQLEDAPQLRDYQRQVAQSAWAQLRQIGVATIQMATGAGKSFLAGYLARQLIRSGYNVVVTALQLDLVYQLRDFARQFGADVHAVTIQSLYRRLNGKNGEDEIIDEEDKEIMEAYADESPLDEVDAAVQALERGNSAIIVDEAHHVPARTVMTVVSHADLRIGLTATPWRNDGRDLDIYAYVGTVVEPRITSSYLIERGFAVPVEIRVIQAPKCEIEVEGEGASAYAAERRAIAECEARNKFIVGLAAKAEKPVLVITQLIKHAETLYRLAKAAGLRAGLATGAVKGDARKQWYDLIRQGSLDVLVATTLADEGLDLPPLRTLIIAIGGKSKTRALQRIGRLVRPWPGKTIAYAYELRDEGTQFFEQHLEERLRLYAAEPRWRIIE